ncbi:peptidylprolyl isomerase [Vibrio sp. SS-MA-C1-2]|uniref:peptidylprolyl isomerase n=1 Tax=Vibrio sp. SS-MA-C1-2 TaxID=2908646 RepID=UPI001F1B63E3|nr:peptidylprolyl isomerase [Vibrio sp. SS-MA-C1-2]UJF18844.1 peptidylprolyl isomerase [Vibrio sp. SS-MA-C1-2]
MKKTILTAAIALSAALFITPSMAAPLVQVTTTDGQFTINLNSEQAPISTKNFLRYVEDGSYVGTQFHRVIAGFMVQGGGFDAKMNKRATYPAIKNEASNGLKNNVATIAMARTQVPDSATRQFFINVKDNGFLDQSSTKVGYAVFGKITEGYSTIEKIAATKTGIKGGMRDVPNTPIVITEIKVIK